MKIKTLSNLGISPTPWSADEILDVIDGNGATVAINVAKGRLDEPNAHLIAAAPELYECLREAVLDACKDCQDTNLSHCDGNCFVARWRKALAKADGEKDE